MNQTSLRIRKLLERQPDMTDAQISRKIGRDNAEGRARVAKERKVSRSERVGDILASCHCGGLFDTCSHCLRRRGKLA